MLLRFEFVDVPRLIGIGRHLGLGGKRARQLSSPRPRAPSPRIARLDCRKRVWYNRSIHELALVDQAGAGRFATGFFCAQSVPQISQTVKSLVRALLPDRSPVYSHTARPRPSPAYTDTQAGLSAASQTARAIRDLKGQKTVSERLQGGQISPALTLCRKSVQGSSERAPLLFQITSTCVGGSVKLRTTILDQGFVSSKPFRIVIQLSS